MPGLETVTNRLRSAHVCWQRSARAHPDPADRRLLPGTRGLALLHLEEQRDELAVTVILCRVLLGIPPHDVTSLDGHFGAVSFGVNQCRRAVAERVNQVRGMCVVRCPPPWRQPGFEQTYSVVLKQHPVQSGATLTASSAIAASSFGTLINYRPGKPTRPAHVSTATVSINPGPPRRSQPRSAHGPPSVVRSGGTTARRSGEGGQRSVKVTALRVESYLPAGTCGEGVPDRRGRPETTGSRVVRRGGLHRALTVVERQRRECDSTGDVIIGRRRDWLTLTFSRDR